MAAEAGKKVTYHGWGDQCAKGGGIASEGRAQALTGKARRGATGSRTRSSATSGTVSAATGATNVEQVWATPAGEAAECEENWVYTVSVFSGGAAGDQESEPETARKIHGELLASPAVFNDGARDKKREPAPGATADPVAEGMVDRWAATCKDPGIYDKPGAYDKVGRGAAKYKDPGVFDKPGAYSVTGRRADVIRDTGLFVEPAVYEKAGRKADVYK